MANDSICVFCGEKLSKFRSATVQCGNTWQPACKNCEKEVKELAEVELCQRALVRGMANDPERLSARIALINEAEDHRPKCAQCGGKMTFMDAQELENTPYRKQFVTEPFEILPACCEACGKYEFYKPEIVLKNKYLAYLIGKDTRG